MNRSNLLLILAGVIVVICLAVLAHKQANYQNNVATTTDSGYSTSSSTPTSTPLENPVAVKPYGNINLKIGEMVNFPEGSLKIISVKEDSRCPANVQCIQAGTVNLNVEYSLNGAVKTDTLGLNKSITRGGEKITLLDVSPQKISTHTITNSEYSFTLNVSKISSPVVSTPSSPIASGGCFVGGCSGEICSDEQGVVSNCIYKSEFACYKTATCERQSNGQCGWTQSSDLKMCLAQAR